jgi:hypothetical protein
LPRNAQKRTKKKIKKKRRYVRTFFCELAQMHVVFSFYFFGRPLGGGCCWLAAAAAASASASTHWHWATDN